MDRAASAFEATRQIQLAFAALGRQQYEEALMRTQAALRAEPRSARSYVTLGVVLQLMHRPGPAADAFAEAVRISPNEVPALFGLGASYAEAGQFEEAEPLLRRALELDPSHFEAKVSLARTLRDMERFAEAEELARRVVAEHPTAARAHTALAVQLQEMGNFAGAREHFQTAMELDPTHGLGFWGVVQGRKMTPDDRPMLESVETLISTTPIPDIEKMELLSGLGKAHDDLREYEKAMRYYIAANRCAAGALGLEGQFSKESYLKYFDEVPRLFTTEFIAENQSREPAKPKPIFVVGMMRSGTTLVEQIVSSHPRVAAGNEIKFWVGEIGGAMDPEHHTFNLHRALAARKKYNKRIRRLAPEADFVTDKMPDNFKVLGALYMLYPDVKIIHCRRNPVDTCLSILMTPFRKPPDFAKDPESLVFMYRQYERTMDHWRQTLPPSALMDVDYEELVQDPEAVTRRMLEFCGLEWNDACLRPEENNRTVVTASVWQVRQPVYRTSVERWRNYEPWLGPLRELLP